MKKMLVGLILLFPLGLGAQPGKAAGKLAPAAFAVENIKVKLPAAVMEGHGAELLQTHIGRQLSLAVYRHLAAQNNRRLIGSLKRFLNQRNTFLKHKAKILANRKIKVHSGTIPYADYLPKDLQMLYVGEWHGVPRIAGEVESLLAQLPAIYPGRRIYLATEFLPVPWKITDWKQRLITQPDELEKISAYNTPVFAAALKAGIPVLGLSDQNSIYAFLWKELDRFPTEQMYWDFAISFEGVRQRNLRWAEILRQVRQADPQALIVVYAGNGHVSYYWDFNLDSMLGGKSFVLSLLRPDYPKIDNPFADYFQVPPDSRSLFEASPEAKLVTGWKKDSPLNKLTGADMAVFLHW